MCRGIRLDIESHDHITAQLADSVIRELAAARNMNPHRRVARIAFDHEHVRELIEIGRTRGAHPEFAEWVFDDLVRGRKNPRSGRRGLSGEQALRVLIVKQMTGFSYDQLSFHLGDGASYRAFCRLGIGERPPSASRLKRNLKRVRAETLEKINWGVLEYGMGPRPFAPPEIEDQITRQLSWHTGTPPGSTPPPSAHLAA